MEFSGRRVTVMGLGRHGGGVAAARWLARGGPGHGDRSVDCRLAGRLDCPTGRRADCPLDARPARRGRFCRGRRNRRQPGRALRPAAAGSGAPARRADHFGNRAFSGSLRGVGRDGHRLQWQVDHGLDAGRHFRPGWRPNLVGGEHRRQPACALAGNPARGSRGAGSEQLSAGPFDGGGPAAAGRRDHQLHAQPPRLARKLGGLRRGEAAGSGTAAGGRVCRGRSDGRAGAFLDSWDARKVGARLAAGAPCAARTTGRT